MHQRKFKAKRGGHSLFLLAVTVAALLLVPAAQAFASGTVTVNIGGSGSGEVSSVNGLAALGGGFSNAPDPIECSYASPGPTTGVCEAELHDEFSEEKSAIGLSYVATAGSVFAGWKVEEGTGFGFTPSPNGPDQCANPEDIECLLAQENFGSPDSHVGLTAIFCLEGETECVFPLTLFVNGPSGSGSVTSTPAGISCFAGEECVEEFSGNVTLTANPEPGYVIAGWIGCHQSGGDPTTCVVKMNEAKEVTAVFLEKGAEGEPGETPTITTLNPGEEGCIAGGIKVELGAFHEVICNGVEGHEGPKGDTGSAGTNGAAGPAGPAGAKGDTGAQGAAGPQGPAGPVGKIVCKAKVKKKGKKVIVNCKIKASASSSRLRWRLMHAGSVVTHGATASGHLRFNHLRWGRYVLHVEGRQGGTRIAIG